MIVIGVLLIVIAAAATAFALMAPSGAAQTIEVTALGFKISASPLAMFITGAAAVILLSLGFVLVSRGAQRKASARKELHQLRKEQVRAGANVPTAEGEGRSRRDRLRHGSSTDSGSTDTSSMDSSSTDTSSTVSSTDSGSTDTGSTDTGSTETSSGTSSDSSR